MKITHDLLNDERGVSTIEFTFTFFVIMVVIMSIYDVLKFQNDMGLVFYNEQIATHHVDLVKLNDKSDEIKEDFELKLREANNDVFFSSLQYSDFAMECYKTLAIKNSVICNNNVKLIKLTYQVRRKYTDNYISALLNIPVVFEREIFIVNDYYN